MATITKIENGDIQFVISFEKGALKLEAAYDSKLVGAGLGIVIPADAVLDEIKKAIPGQIDDAVIELIKSALKNI